MNRRTAAGIAVVGLFGVAGLNVAFVGDAQDPTENCDATRTGDIVTIDLSTCEEVTSSTTSTTSVPVESSPPNATATPSTPTPALSTTTTVSVPGTSSTSLPEPSTTTSTTTTTVPPPAPTVPATTIPPVSGPLPSIASNFDRNAWLVTGEPVPGSSASEPSGNFRTVCGFSHLGYDDPIVYPGVVGASHLHMFFGNTGTNAHSTYQSIRTTGSSTCQGGPLNRTSYWMPAVHNAAGKVVVPSYFQIYYKGNGTQAEIGRIATSPNGLRMIAGYNPANPNAHRGYWSCVGSSTVAVTIPNCAAGVELKVELRFPMCWDGRNIDSADHRSHMATGPGGWFPSGGCPASHPVHLPEFTLIAVFVSDGNSRNWYLSSDLMPGMQPHPNGSTFHADWFGAWDNTAQELWTQECIREMRNCSWGSLGDGTRLKDHGTYTGPRLIDPPAR